MSYEDNSHDIQGGFCDSCSHRGRLRSIYTERLQEIDRILYNIKPVHGLSVTGSLFSGIIAFDFPELALVISHQRGETPMLSHRLENKTLSRKGIDSLRVSMRQAWDSPSLAPSSSLDVAVVALQMVEQVIETLDVLHFPDRERKLAELRRKAEVAPLVDVESVQDVISRFIGTKPRDFLNGLTERMETDYRSRAIGLRRVVHCEVVMRSDLTTRFLKARRQLERALQECALDSLTRSVPADVRRGTTDPVKLRALMIQYLCTPRLTYHGTTAAAVPSIVQHGFLMPGSTHPKTGEPVRVRCGSTFGRGIYTSPDPLYSFSYCKPDNGDSSAKAIAGSKLMVCLTLMGRAVQLMYQPGREDVRQATRAIEGGDSHVSSSMLEYVVFDAAAVLPCYVVHLDWGESDTARVTADNRAAQMLQKHASRKLQHRILSGPNSGMSPGDKQRAKEERLAQSRKLFPYGFGPVSGDKVLIEEVAYVSDDEEDYGEYQAMRVDVDAEAKGYWDWDDMPGAAAQDQYRDARLLKAGR